ncbi:hypothetical protein V6N12_065201 [Hibiscus sabdariffa]|uniref:Uncharacterized protein n=1 Tax=Hibiscus sabdariffa TaxID=183260 RepID=A0ABR2G852_9ROSI
MKAGGLFELPIKGGEFTWSNKRTDGDGIMEILDIILFNFSWNSLFSNAYGIMEPAIGSDHDPTIWFPTLVPNTIQVVENFHRRFITSFNYPLFTFVVVNIIVVVVYVLTSQKQTTSHDIDIYHEYVSSRRSIPTVVPATKETLVDKEIVLVENAVILSQVKVKQQCSSSIVETITETKHSLSLVKHKKPEYRRTQSMVLESRSCRIPMVSGDGM